jgi:hypothetical protein
MIIHLQFGFSQFISFREEDLWNFSQSEHIIGPGSHVEYPTGTKNCNFVEDHPRNIPAKFGSNWPSGFGEEAWNVKCLQTTDDGRQVMAIVHLDLWSRWTKNIGYHVCKQTGRGISKVNPCPYSVTRILVLKKFRRTAQVEQKLLHGSDRKWRQNPQKYIWHFISCTTKYEACWKISQKNLEYMLIYSLQCSCSYNFSSFWPITK